MSAKKILLVGAGGIGAPAALALAHAFRDGAAIALLVADDDEVEATNLHRQVLYRDEDVGRSKLAAFKDALAQVAPALPVELYAGRFVPDVARDLCARADVVLDASDNFATRLLAADTARLVGRPVVHAASVRWNATVIAAAPAGRPCYRCLFEDFPEGDAPDCATAGVVGPVCGVAGAIGADLALRALAGDASAFGAIFTYDGRRDGLRRVAVGARAGCALCGTSPRITAIDEARYVDPSSCLGGA